mmetsp:Transcript_126593/g.394088  ORF Transcript_126593/g.394088 Transcript_126593/m.394088 type:complete len:284 (+) Transcript_126593:92-943(+)
MRRAVDDLANDPVLAPDVVDGLHPVVVDGAVPREAVDVQRSAGDGEGQEGLEAVGRAPVDGVEVYEPVRQAVHRLALVRHRDGRERGGPARLRGREPLLEAHAALRGVGALENDGLEGAAPGVGAELARATEGRVGLASAAELLPEILHRGGEEHVGPFAKVLLVLRSGDAVHADDGVVAVDLPPQAPAAHVQRGAHERAAAQGPGAGPRRELRLDDAPVAELDAGEPPGSLLQALGGRAKMCGREAEELQVLLCFELLQVNLGHAEGRGVLRLRGLLARNLR